MKNFNFTFLIILGILFTVVVWKKNNLFCQMKMYTVRQVMQRLHYSVSIEAMVQYEYYGNEFLFLTNVNSGLMVTRRTGNQK